MNSSSFLEMERNKVKKMSHRNVCRKEDHCKKSKSNVVPRPDNKDTRHEYICIHNIYYRYVQIQNPHQVPMRGGGT